MFAHIANIFLISRKNVCSKRTTRVEGFPVESMVGTKRRPSSVIGLFSQKKHLLLIREISFCIEKCCRIYIKLLVVRHFCFCASETAAVLCTIIPYWGWKNVNTCFHIKFQNLLFCNTIMVYCVKNQKKCLLCTWNINSSRMPGKGQPTTLVIQWHGLSNCSCPTLTNKIIFILPSKNVWCVENVLYSLKRNPSAIMGRDLVR